MTKVFPACRQAEDAAGGGEEEGWGEAGQGSVHQQRAPGQAGQAGQAEGLRILAELELEARERQVQESNPARSTSSGALLGKPSGKKISCCFVFS